MSTFLKNIKLSDREEKINDVKSILPDMNLENIFKQFKQNIDNVKSKFEIYEILSNNNYEKSSKDILRSQIVFLMSTLDFYMHEIARYSLLQMFRGEKEKTNSYKNFIVSITVVEKALQNPESVDWLSEEIVYRNSHKTFMSSKEIKNTLSLISNKKIYSEIEERLDMKGKLTNKLKEIYKRRNKIVHQSDRIHNSDNLYEVKKETVEEYVYIIENMGQIICDILIEDI